MNQNGFILEENCFQIKEGAIQLFVIDVGLFSLDKLMENALLKDSEKKIFDSFGVDSRKKEWCAVRAFLNSFFCKKIEIEYRGSKPYLLNKKDWSVSISHTGHLVAIALSDRNVGVDIEQIDEPKIEKIAKKFTNNIELGRLKCVKNKYTTIWASKEAIYKYYNKKGLRFKEDVNLYCANDEFIKAEVQLDSNKEVVEVFLVRFRNCVIAYV